MKNVKDYSTFIFSRILPSFFPLLQIIAVKYIVNNPLELSKIIILIAIQTQLALLIAANRDEKLFIQLNKNQAEYFIFSEILKRLFFSFFWGLPISILLSLFNSWELSFSAIYLILIFSVHKSLDKLLSLFRNEIFVIFNLVISFLFYLLILFLTKSVVYSFLFSSIISLLFYLLRFFEINYLIKYFHYFKSNINLKNLVVDFTSYEQMDVRLSSIVIFLSTRLDQFALASLAATSSPFVIAYLTFKKFIDFICNFFVLFYSKNTFEKTRIYSSNKLVDIYAKQLINFLLVMFLITIFLAFLSYQIYDSASCLIILLVLASAILNSWGSQKGPAYTRFKLQKKNFIFLVSSLLFNLPIYLITGFNLISTLLTALITGILVNLFFPILFIDFDRKVLSKSMRLLINKFKTQKKYFKN